MDFLEARKNKARGRAVSSIDTVSYEELRNSLRSKGKVAAGYRLSYFQYDVGKKMRQIREAAGLSQRELARMAGTTQALINKIESCHTPSNPTVETLFKLAAACGCRPTLTFDVVKSSRVLET
jgi:ribosome-binding protein aMBF1 (putative translation factor)